jgi:hypothetical protein
MIYRKLKRVSAHGYGNYIPNFKEVFPELSNISSEEISNRWDNLGIDFYTEKRQPVPILRRLTLPFGLLTLLILFISLPIAFIVKGYWGYDFGKKSFVYNWLKSLGLQ